ncbi:uncharacterized protein LOC120346273 isoform X2 [Styela clava]
MNVLNEILEGLEFAFQKHEKEIVTELAADRLLHFIGVYLILVLAVLSKALEISDENISCFPVDNTTKLGTSFMKYANSHCWYSSRVTTEYGDENTAQYRKCLTREDRAREELLIDNPNPVNSFVQCLSYSLLLQALLFAIPSVWWHHRVGARLIGHLLFVKSFLKEVYENLRNIPAGIYRKLPYDKEGNYLDGWGKFKPRYKQEHQGMSTTQENENDSTKNAGTMDIFNRELTLNEVIDVAVNSDIKEEEKEQKTLDTNEAYNRICGSMKDRQLFSMLCYENFASLEYYSYIMSVQSLTSTPAADGDRRGIVPLQKGIWRQFTHKDNFTGDFLIRSYMTMCIMRLVLSFVIFIVLWIIFSQSFAPTFSTKSFTCDLPLHNLCLVCVIKRHWDVTALFLIDVCVIFVYFGLSAFQFYFVRFGSNRAVCHYLEDMKDSMSVAFLSAWKASQRRRKKQS